MPRDLDDDLDSALADPSIRPVLFFEAELTGGSMRRVWSGLGDYEWNGVTWEGAGGIIGIARVEETQNIRAAGVQVTLAGITSASLSEALQSLRQNRPGRIYLGLRGGTDYLGEDGDIFGSPGEVLTFADGSDDLGEGSDVFGEDVEAFAFVDRTPGALVGEPVLAFEGRLDSAEIEKRPEGGLVVMRYESRLVDLERPRGGRRTHEDQQTRASGDKIFEFVPSLQDKVIAWGATGGAAPSGGLFGT